MAWFSPAFGSLPLLLIAAIAAAHDVAPDAITPLLAVDAKRSAGLSEFQPGGHGKFFATGWDDSGQRATWPITVAAPADYAARLLLRRSAGGPLVVELTAGTATVSAVLAADVSGWQRLPLDGPLPLGPDIRELTLRLRPAQAGEAFAADVHAVELVQPAVRDALHARALALRTDTAWLRRARYGVMVHWTSESMPLAGPPQPYAEAVAAFDTEAFAEAMARTGAGFVVFTTSHARMFFPAPLAALDAVLPGRTASRDLVADLAAALGRRGIKLMLYFHQGCGGDPEWLRESGFDAPDSRRFYGIWQAMIREAGTRYGERLAGWWFDDGAVAAYPRNPPWEDLTRAAKAGCPERLVCFNRWELASPTEFQDFDAGEGCTDPRGSGGLLARGGDGRYPSGPQAGLQATACLMAQAAWVHDRRDAVFHPPRWNAAELAEMLRAFAAHGNVPIFNLEIGQQGELSPDAVEMLHRAGRAADD
jgi:hypothetical protein